MDVGTLRELIKDLPDETKVKISNNCNTYFLSFPVQPEIEELHDFDFNPSIETIFYEVKKIKPYERISKFILV